MGAAALVAGASVATTTAEAVELRTRMVGVDPGTRMIGPRTADHRKPTRAASPGSHGGTLVIDEHGLLVVDRRSQKLIRSDRSGAPVASLDFDGALGELVRGRGGRVFLADRGGDRVVRIDPGDAEGRGLAVAGSSSVREPHGMALTPDGQTLLVTSVAEHELVGLAADTLERRWAIELAPEPRGVAVSSDGSQAAVGFLTSGSVALVDLAWAGTDTPQVHWQVLEPRDHVALVDDDDGWGEPITVARIEEARSRFEVPVETGRRYARAGFGLAYLGDDTLVAAHQLATPQLRRVPARDRSDTYGGGDESIEPMVHRLGLIQAAGRLDAKTHFIELDVHQPRALAYDLEHDTLFVGGYGDDRVVALVDATQQMPYVDWFATLGDDCGVDGLALDDDGGIWVHCEFRRQVVRLDPGDASTPADDTWLQGPELAASAHDELVDRGADLFRRSNPDTSDGGTLACSNCHPEGRADGLTWRLGKSTMQVPVLAGRVGGTGPYKWDGQDPTLHDSLRHTMQRLGGDPGSLPARDFDALVAYLEDLPAPEPKSPEDPEAVARGRAVFEAEACNACHVGPKLADGSQHDLGTTMDQVDTPSLIALGHSRPYYHDGSAIDLITLLRDRGTIHEMADVSGLDERQVHDLAAYLESL